MTNNTLLRNFLLFLFMVFIFVGCGNNTPAPVAKTTPLPAWINSPLPKDNDNYIYGMGIEYDRELAIKAALNDMIAKLGTTIESSYQSNELVQGSYNKSTIQNQIKTVVSKININNYQVIKSHKISYREFAVMIESDKQKLVSGLKENLEIEKKLIEQKYASLTYDDILSQYNTKKELSNKANDLLSKVLIISELDKNFDKQTNLNFIANKQEQFLQASRNLKFYVTGDSASIKFVDTIKNYLAQNNYNVSNSQDGSVIIKIDTSDRVSNNISILTMNVSILNDSRRIGGRTVILKERYNGSSDSVYKNAAIHLKQDIKDQGINQVIGINLNID